jgi:hypothetical protein
MAVSRHRAWEFIGFLNPLEKEVPRDHPVHLIMDNYSSGIFLIPHSLDVGTAIDELLPIWLVSDASDWEDRPEWL